MTYEKIKEKEGKLHMGNTIYQIYDKLFKKILTLSSTAVVNLINGLFGTAYPADSTITYNWTEFEGEDLRKILADTILTINGRYSYHMEAQMEKEETIILRVFDYGYAHAIRNATEERGRCRLTFPEPKVIYLYSTGKVPDEYELEIDFGEQGSFLYKAGVCKFQEISTEEINRRKMVILIPFTLLRVREMLKKERSRENLELLKTLIQDDIIGSISKNLELGNITTWDARKLKRYTLKLYEHMYSHFKEMEALNEMTDESLMLDVDILEMKFEMLERQIDEKERELGEKERELGEKERELDENKQQHAEEMNALKDVITEKETEIEKLKAALSKAGIQV